MEVLSGVASVIAVIQLTSFLARTLKTYYCGAGEARSDIKRLFSAVSSLELLLRQIDALPPSAYTTKLSELLDDPQSPLELIKVELEAVRLAIATPKKGKTKLGSLAQSLKWPLKSIAVMETVTVIDRHKATLNSHLGLGIIGLQIKDLDILSSIQNDLTEARDDRRREKIIRWLSKGLPDPSVEHNAKREQHVEGTGQWLIESKEFRSWMECNNSCIWLNGGLGTGKSVLCSTVIEHLKLHSRLEVGCLSVVTYWYFSFSDTASLTVSNALCSVTRDLCSRSLVLPPKVEIAWLDSNKGQQRPTSKSILEMLVALLQHFDKVYIVVDGIDEVTRTARETLLHVISGLLSLGIHSLRLIVASRPEVDIGKCFRSFPLRNDNFSTISLYHDRVEKDILMFLDRKLESDHCRKWSVSERLDMRGRLCTQAEGMFRLVALQWSLVTKSLSPSKRRAALLQLPQSLNEFYEQQLAKINEIFSEAVQKALCWLLFSTCSLTVGELAEAAILTPSLPPFLDPAERFDDPEGILEIVPSCFIKVVNLTNPGSHNFGADFAVHLSHQSVKEFLHSSANLNWIENTIWDDCVAYMLAISWELRTRKNQNSDELMIEFPLLKYVLANWISLFKPADENILDSRAKHNVEDDHHTDERSQSISFSLVRKGFHNASVQPRATYYHHGIDDCGKHHVHDFLLLAFISINIILENAIKPDRQLESTRSNSISCSEIYPCEQCIMLPNTIQSSPDTQRDYFVAILSTALIMFGPHFRRMQFTTALSSYISAFLSKDYSFSRNFARYLGDLSGWRTLKGGPLTSLLVDELPALGKTWKGAACPTPKRRSTTSIFADKLSALKKASKDVRWMLGGKADELQSLNLMRISDYRTRLFRFIAIRLLGRWSETQSSLTSGNRIYFQRALARLVNDIQHSTAN